MKVAKKDIKKVMDSKLKYGVEGCFFMHCKYCLKEFDENPKGMSPQEAMAYEISSYPFEYPNGITANIIVVWCKKCHRQVWDTRHLKHLF